MRESESPLRQAEAEIHPQRPRELAMSAAWHGALTRAFETTDGARIDVIFHGHWSHGFGPDFVDAMIESANAGLQNGAVEIHTKSSDWYRHGHHLDPRYNTVVLHVVSIVDVAETRRADGKLIPTAVLNIPDAVLFGIDQRLPDIWSELGGSVCADDLARREPERIRNAILRLGDIRLNDRVQRHEGALATEPASSIMLRALFDAFGFSENRLPMMELADALIRHGIRDRLHSVSPADRFDYAATLLLGLSGFLPMSPPDGHVSLLDPAHLHWIEARWHSLAPDLYETPLSPTRWTRARTRPANHPVARLVTAATMLATTGGDPFGVLIEGLRCGADLSQSFRTLCSAEGRPALGAARSVAITASVILPVALAYARDIGDPELEDAASRAWASLPTSEWSRPAKRALAQAAGTAPIKRLGERGIQGLLHLDRALCTPRRCYECPIAAEVVRDRQS